MAYSGQIHTRLRYLHESRSAFSAHLFRSAPIMSAVGKRKRPEYESSDDEAEPTLGRRVLPVANLPFDFDGVPEDGAQYLFTVRCVCVPWLRLGPRCTVDADLNLPRRRDASLLPHITRVDNPYAIPEVTMDVAPGPSGSGTSRPPAMPSQEWRSVVEGRFKNLKKVRVVRFASQRLLR